VEGQDARLGRQRPGVDRGVGALGLELGLGLGLGLGLEIGLG